jgi:sec-independent protein translocase protein TatC
VALRYYLELTYRNVVDGVLSITEYFDLFVNSTLGVGLALEVPVLMLLLTLLRIASPRLLLRHSRYAILAIVIIAAIATPTPDVFDQMLFAIPACATYFLGIFASFLMINARAS